MSFENPPASSGKIDWTVDYAENGTERQNIRIDQMIHRLDVLIAQGKLSNRLVRALILLCALQVFSLVLLVILRMF
jgi:hypothetical protein